MQIFCLPHAGSSAWNYLQWRKYTDQRIEIVPLELAGRGEKQNLPLRQTMEETISDVIGDFKNAYTGGKYAVFGHSLGAWIAYELYYHFEEENIPLPESMIFSGNCTPFSGKEGIVRMDMQDDEFMEKLISLGGMSRQILTENSLYNTYKQIFRADFSVAESYTAVAVERQITCPVIVLGGTEDSSVSTEDLMEWRKVTTGRYTIRKIAGNHFFPFINAEETVAFINEQLLQ